MSILQYQIDLFHWLTNSRYVGTIVEINSEQSTIALEDVTSFGTEGRRSGNDEIPPSDLSYDYIVFRGSDMKDLRIEETPKEAKPAPPTVLNEPAIRDSGAKNVRNDGPSESDPILHPPAGDLAAAETESVFSRTSILTFFTAATRPT